MNTKKTYLNYGYFTFEETDLLLKWLSKKNDSSITVELNTIIMLDSIIDKLEETKKQFKNILDGKTLKTGETGYDKLLDEYGYK
jgi:hypothetical protein